jgi:arsenite methyltransferase
VTTSFAHDSASLAETYDRVSDSQFEAGVRMLERVGVKAGDRVLDVGCGTGRLARWIAGRVGPSGSVVGIDPLVERIGLARAHAAGVSFEVGQAEDLSAFPAESFDAVSMSAVLHWVSDKPRALAEVRRVLRPGGRLGMTTMARELIGVSTAAEVCTSVLGRSPYVERVDVSALAVASRGHTTTELITTVLGSGLELTELHVVARARNRGRGADVVDFLESSSFGNFLRMVPEEQRPSLRADLAAAFEQRGGPDGVTMRDHGMVLVATRPAA